MFINEYKITKKQILEYVYNILCKRYFIIGYISSIISLLLFLKIDSEIKFIFFSCFIILFITTIIFPFVMTNEIIKLGKRLNNGKEETTKISFNKKIIMDEGNTHLEFEYSQIKKILETKNFIVLLLDKNSSILVFKYGFTKGNINEFNKFIKDKIGV